MKAAMSPSGDPAEIEAAWHQARERVADYLRDLGVSDAGLLQALASDCLLRAHRQVGKGSGDDLLRRGLEEVQRRMDSALAKFFGLNPTRDTHKIAAARAALLCCAKGTSTDFLFGAADSEKDRLSLLTACLPIATPPESPLPMPAQRLDFFFFKSTATGES